MVKVEYSIVINRPVAEVFTYVTDPANNAKWQEGLVESRQASSGPMGLGAQVVDVRKFLGRDMDSKLEVTASEPNKKFSEKVNSGPLKFEITNTFEASGSGTKLTVSLQGEPGGFFKLAEGMVEKQLRSQFEGDAGRLKKVLEG
jgi:uncharacterized protein YndB with AHSA1/START domain